MYANKLNVVKRASEGIERKYLRAENPLRWKREGSGESKNIHKFHLLTFSYLAYFFCTAESDR